MRPPHRQPTRRHFLARVRAFRRREQRDAMYTVATFLVRHSWGKPGEMADALGVLLLTWNQAFYRYGPFDSARLERCLRAHLPTLRRLRRRSVASLTRADRPPVARLFRALLRALRIRSGPRRGHSSPVAVAKALHLLAPRCLPLWDDAIARAYGCHYAGRDPAERYWTFCERTRTFARHARPWVRRDGRPLLKALDEYNYATYTKGWR
ncbi:MAG: hypothetical protein HY553_16700 [Elusimicrobia bacterium]|nr:hypothetical protein [Elusimicrobiota bacterium]